MGKSPCGCYAITVNPGADDFADRLFDFITYENLYNRRVLIYSPVLISNRFCLIISLKSEYVPMTRNMLFTVLC